MDLQLISRPKERPERPKRRMGSQKASAILSASCQHFASFGYLGTRLEDVALTANVTRATIYAHYKSKEHLFAVCLAELSAHIIRPEELIGPTGSDVRAHLTEIGSRMVDSALSPPALGIYRMLMTPHPEITGAAGEFWTLTVDPLRRAFTDVLLMWQARGAITVRSAERASAQYFSLVLNDPTLKWLTNPHNGAPTFDLEDHLEEAVDLFLRAHTCRLGST